MFSTERKKEKEKHPTTRDWDQVWSAIRNTGARNHSQQVLQLPVKEEQRKAGLLISYYSPLTNSEKLTLLKTRTAVCVAWQCA